MMEQYKANPEKPIFELSLEPQDEAFKLNSAKLN